MFSARCATTKSTWSASAFEVWYVSIGRVPAMGLCATVPKFKSRCERLLGLIAK